MWRTQLLPIVMCSPLLIACSDLSSTCGRTGDESTVNCGEPQLWLKQTLSGAFSSNQRYRSTSPSVAVALTLCPMGHDVSLTLCFPTIFLHQFLVSCFDCISFASKCLE